MPVGRYPPAAGRPLIRVTYVAELRSPLSGRVKEESER